jgi:hypothetical protein
MSKYSLQYRAARRRAFNSIPMTQKLVISNNNTQSKPNQEWQNATYSGFNPESGQYQVRNAAGEVFEVDRIPGYGAEFGGVSSGSSGLLSEGFWSN